MQLIVKLPGEVSWSGCSGAQGGRTARLAAAAGGPHPGRDYVDAAKCQNSPAVLASLLNVNHVNVREGQRVLILTATLSPELSARW